MNFQVGRVKEYNKISGTITTSNETYLFLEKDVNDDIEVNDYVLFRGEKVNGDNRAYFVKFFSKNAEDFNDKTILHKFIMRGN